MTWVSMKELHNARRPRTEAIGAVGVREPPSTGMASNLNGGIPDGSVGER
jgi:hypothetical protein